MDQIQGGVIHLVKFVYLKNALDLSGEVVHDVSVFSVERGLAVGDEIELEIAFFLMGHPVRQAGVHAEGDILSEHAPVKAVAGQLLALPDGGEHQRPGVQLVGGNEKPRLRVQGQRFVVLAFFRALCRFQPGVGRVAQRRLNTFFLLLHQLRRQYAELVQRNLRCVQMAVVLLPAQLVELVERVVRGNLDQRGVRGDLRSRLRCRSLLRKEGVLRGVLRWGTEQEGHEFIHQRHVCNTTILPYNLVHYTR